MIHSALTLGLAFVVRSGMAQDLTLSFPDPAPTGSNPTPSMTIAPLSGQSLVSCGEMSIGLGSNLADIASDDNIGLWIVTTPDQNRAITGHPSKRAENVSTAIGMARLADSFYSWEHIAVFPGWYALHSQVANGLHQGLEAWSAPFRITEGRDTSCLPLLPTSSSSTSDTTSQPLPTDSTTPSSSPSQSTPVSGGHKTNAGAIAGPVIGALAVIAFVALGGLFIRRRLAQKRINEKSASAIPEDPFVDPAPRPTSGNWGAIAGSQSQPSPRLRNSFGPVLTTRDISEAHNMKDMESQDAVPPLARATRTSTSSIQMLVNQRTGPSSDTLPSSDGLPQLTIPSGRTTPSIPRSAAESDSGHSSGANLTRQPSTNATPARPARKPVPAYIPAPDDTNIVPSQVQDSFGKSLEMTLALGTSGAASTTASKMPSPVEEALAHPGQSERTYHYLMPDPLPPPRD